MILKWVIVDRSPGQRDLTITRPFSTKSGAEGFKESLESTMPRFNLRVKKIVGKKSDFY
tara:strand:- start:1399 stop:1575 length:177 start_codon:yes stop_codon:yes gene_type:complete